MKGVAIILMLIHHLFYEEASVENCFVLLPQGKVRLLAFAQMCKVCVAMFLLLSGYGLYKSWSNRRKSVPVTWKEGVAFTAQRIKKLLVQYWWAVLPLAVLGIVSGMRPLSEVYGTNLADNLKIITDLLGINFILYGFSNMYNVTCWYLGVAIGLYLIYPVLDWLLRKNIFLLFGILLSVGLYSDRFLFLRDPFWLFPFAMGMMFARYGILDAVCCMASRRNWFVTLGAVVFLLATAKIRIGYPPFITDGLLAFAIICAVLVAVQYVKPVASVLQLLGKHSANIFMTHTFFYYYYFTDYFYAIKVPILILASLLLVCVLYSISLEKIKQILFRKPTEIERI